VEDALLVGLINGSEMSLRKTFIGLRGFGENEYSKSKLYPLVGQDHGERLLKWNVAGKNSDFG